jgi:pimeloyl-ACP methyl ester carboxylesterase
MADTERERLSIWRYLDKLAFTQGYVKTGAHATRYIQAGPKDAPPLIMVHGMGGTWENFIANVGAHAQHFNVVAFDLLGHGYSDKPDQTLAVEDYVQQLGALVDAFGFQRVSLLGLSIGGWISTKFTVRQPERVDRLLVLSAWGRPRAVEPPEVQARMKAMMEKRLKAVDEPTFQAMDDIFEGLVANPAQRMEDLLALRLRVYKLPGMSRNMRNVFAGISPPVWDRNMLTDDELRSVSRPTLVVGCVDHPDVFLKMAQEYRALIPGVQYAEIRHASHWPQWEEADALNEMSLAFFRA